MATPGTATYLRVGLRALGKDWGLVLVRGGAGMAGQMAGAICYMAAGIWMLRVGVKALSASHGLFDLIGGLYSLARDWRLFAVLGSALVLARGFSLAVKVTAETGCVGVLCGGTARQTGGTPGEFLGAIGRRLADYLTLSLVMVALWLGVVLWGVCGWAAGQVLVERLGERFGGAGVFAGCAVTMLGVFVGTMLGVATYLVGVYARLSLFLDDEGVFGAIRRAVAFLSRNFEAALRTLTWVGVAWTGVALLSGSLLALTAVVPGLLLLRPVLDLLVLFVAALVWVWSQGSYAGLYTERSGRASISDLLAKPPPPEPTVFIPPAAYGPQQAHLDAQADIVDIGKILPDLPRPGAGMISSGEPPELVPSPTTEPPRTFEPPTPDPGLAGSVQPPAAEPPSRDPDPEEPPVEGTPFRRPPRPWWLESKDDEQPPE